MPSTGVESNCLERESLVGLSLPTRARVCPDVSIFLSLGDDKVLMSCKVVEIRFGYRRPCGCMLAVRGTSLAQALSPVRVKGIYSRDECGLKTGRLASRRHSRNAEPS
jgi:hypothetical protein